MAEPSGSRPVIHVARYGAALDGATDDTAAFARALAVARQQGGGRVVFDGPTRLKNLALVSNVELVGVGNPLVALAPASANDVAIAGIGAVTGSATALTANVTEGAEQVTVASTRGLAVGDRILISEQTFVFGTGGRRQEINRIAALPGRNAVGLQTGLIDSYTTGASAVLQKLLPVCNFVLSGFTIENAVGVNGGGVGLTLCSDFNIDSVGVIGPAAFPGMRFTSCARGDVRLCLIRDGQGITPGGSAGLAFDIIEACHHIDVHDNSLLYYNEVEIGNRCRHIQFTKNHCKHADNAVNTHGNHNAHVLIADNDIADTVNAGIAVGYSIARTCDSDVKIVRNRIVNSGSHAISIAAAGGAGRTNRRITVEDNEIAGVKLKSAASSCGVFCDRSDEVSISGNRIDGTKGVNGADAAISVNNGARCTVRSNQIANFPSGYGVQMVACSDYEVAFNHIANCASNVSTASSTGSCRVRANVADDPRVSIDRGASQDDNSWNSGRGRRG
jgi:hypothetical protein